ncbi:MmcQ/YjbR family DNA-binding protein [Pseudomonas xantholysinigenes]|uniref:MmcQ/YjbR family DNA-binding protein n=1 Tax=Pseudomonas xantholysinigenes TaxID=2745490 RepID=A0A9E6Q1D4_9PSED|nr:MmcQ/YjbR family DNA-binding protein [Pseudomonas xantholysinigenes]QXI40655.1 MmcQ/YjbR family DNA-binding protein [Pseudomonas xantholysinigenes]
MSEQRMTAEQVATFCLALPGAQEDYKWGGIRVFSVAGNKMFAIQGLSGDGLAFKLADELFLGYCDRPGIRPAPYLARAKWVSLEYPYPMGREEISDLLRRSHQLVVRRLPKRLQVGLLLD